MTSPSQVTAEGPTRYDMDGGRMFPSPVGEYYTVCAAHAFYSAEITRLREDCARYESGRVVLLAELNAAKQLAMRQANQIRQLAGAAMMRTRE